MTALSAVRKWRNTQKQKFTRCCPTFYRILKRVRYTDFVAKRKTAPYFLQQLFSTLNNLICCTAALNLGGKTHKIYATCSTCAKQVARFCCPFYRSSSNWTGRTITHAVNRYLYIFHNTPCLLPKILHNFCLKLLLGISVVPREIACVQTCPLPQKKNREKRRQQQSRLKQGHPTMASS